MKVQNNIYLLIENPLLKRGIEEFIKPKYQTYSLSLDSFLIELGERDKIKEEIAVLIGDYRILKFKNPIFVNKFLSQYPLLKVILLFEDFDFDEIRTYFSLGIQGAIDKRVDPEELIVLIERVMEGKRIISKAFEQNLIEFYCSVDKNVKIVFDSAGHPESSHLDRINASKLFGLTNRENEILFLICEGKSTKEISDKLSISPYTTDTHRRNLLQKLDVKNTAEMVKVAILNQLVY